MPINSDYETSSETVDGAHSVKAFPRPFGWWSLFGISRFSLAEANGSFSTLAELPSIRLHFVHELCTGQNLPSREVRPDNIRNKIPIGQMQLER